MQPSCLSRFLVPVALVAAVAVGITGTSPLAAEDKKEEGWISLFNGKDFTGWKIPDPPSGTFKSVKEVKNSDGKVTAFIGVNKKDDKEITLWQIKDGTIVGGGPASHIFTEIEAEDFHYRVEAKINDKGNSGQYFRTKFGPGFPQGYEAQINATGGDKIKTGSLYLPAVKEVLVLDTAPHKADEFFVQEVIAEGDHIQIFVNGKKTVDFKDPNKTYTKGHFALQGHDPGSVMTFKKVEYKPIKK
jgi:3-keto-disaccharide hydrolase